MGNQDIVSHFKISPNNKFTLKSYHERDSATLGFDFTIGYKSMLYLKFAYEGEARSGYSGHSGNLTAKLVF